MIEINMKIEIFESRAPTLGTLSLIRSRFGKHLL